MRLASSIMQFSSTGQRQRSIMSILNPVLVLEAVLVLVLEAVLVLVLAVGKDYDKYRLPTQKISLG